MRTSSVPARGGDIQRDCASYPEEHSAYAPGASVAAGSRSPPFESSIRSPEQRDRIRAQVPQLDELLCRLGAGRVGQTSVIASGGTPGGTSAAPAMASTALPARSASATTTSARDAPATP